MGTADIQAIIICLSHPYKENSNSWLVDILSIEEATILYQQLLSINDDKNNYTNGYLHLGLKESAFKKLYDIHPRSIPKIIECNCRNMILGKCFLDLNGKEHYNINQIPYIFEYKLMIKPKLNC